MEKEPPSRTADQFVVRLPPGMRDQIAAAAKAAGRSMNAEIVLRLQTSFMPVPAGAEGVVVELKQFFLQELTKLVKQARDEAQTGDRPVKAARARK